MFSFFNLGSLERSSLAWSSESFNRRNKRFDQWMISSSSSCFLYRFFQIPGSFCAMSVPGATPNSKHATAASRLEAFRNWPSGLLPSCAVHFPWERRRLT
jgi:hypothetical protein